MAENNEEIFTSELQIISEIQIDDFYKDIIELPEDYDSYFLAAGCIKVTNGRLPK